jgi:hypothetical protein
VVDRAFAKYGTVVLNTAQYPPAEVVVRGLDALEVGLYDIPREMYNIIFR